MPSDAKCAFDRITVNEISSLKPSHEKVRRYSRIIYPGAINSTARRFPRCIRSSFSSNGYTCRYPMLVGIRFADNVNRAVSHKGKTIRRRRRRRAGEKQSREVVRAADARLLSTRMRDLVRTGSMLIRMVVGALRNHGSLSRTVKSFIDDFATIYTNAPRGAPNIERRTSRSERFVSLSAYFPIQRTRSGSVFYHQIIIVS